MSLQLIGLGCGQTRAQAACSRAGLWCSAPCQASSRSLERPDSTDMVGKILNVGPWQVGLTGEVLLDKGTQFTTPGSLFSTKIRALLS